MIAGQRISPCGANPNGLHSTFGGTLLGGAVFALCFTRAVIVVLYGAARPLPTQVSNGCASSWPSKYDVTSGDSKKCLFDGSNGACTGTGMQDRIIAVTLSCSGVLKGEIIVKGYGIIDEGASWGFSEDGVKWKDSGHTECRRHGIKDRDPGKLQEVRIPAPKHNVQHIGFANENGGSSYVEFGLSPGATMSGGDCTRAATTPRTTAAAPTDSALTLELKTLLDQLSTTVDSNSQLHEETLKSEVKTIMTLITTMQDEIAAIAKAQTELQKSVKLLSEHSVSRKSDVTRLSDEVEKLTSLVAANGASIGEWQYLDPATLDPPARESCTGLDCSPEISSADDGTLTIVAPGGRVVFESDQCPETDLCRLATEVQALLAKFSD